MPNQRQNGGAQGSTIASAIGPLSNQRHGSALLGGQGPVLLSCVCALRQWPKFMIACICAPDRILDAEGPPSNEMPPTSTTTAVCGLECALLFVLAMQVMRWVFLLRSLLAQRIADLVAAMHSLTLRSRRFTRPPSLASLLILPYIRSTTSVLPVLPQYAPSRLD